MFWLAQLPPLQVVYPADQQKTQADRIFLIGTADPR